MREFTVRLLLWLAAAMLCHATAFATAVCEHGGCATKSATPSHVPASPDRIAMVRVGANGIEEYAYDGTGFSQPAAARPATAGHSAERRPEGWLAAVPQPSNLWLLMVGLVVMAIRRVPLSVGPRRLRITGGRYTSRSNPRP